MKKKLLAILLATAMATMMVSGCGKASDHTNIDDEDDDDDEKKDKKDKDDNDVVDGGNGIAIVDEPDDFVLEISEDSILYGVDFDIRMFYGDYVIDGEKDTPEYYEMIKNLSSGTITAHDSYWDSDVEVYNFPCKIELGCLGEFFTPAFWSDDYSSVSYASGQYNAGYPTNEELNVLKMDLINKYGDKGIEYYNNAMKSYALSYAIIEFPEADGQYTEGFGAVVELIGNELVFHNYNYNEDQTVDVLDEFYRCYVDFDGINLEVGSNGTIVEMVPYDFSNSFRYLAAIAFVEDKSQALDGLSGFFITDDDMDGDGKFSHGYMADGSESYDFENVQQFEYSEDGTFKLNYFVNVVNRNGHVEYLENSESEMKVVEGRYVWCDNRGVIFRVDNKFYYFLYTADNYYASVYGNNGIPEDNGNGATYADSINVHEQVSSDLSDAFGTDANVDDISGAVTMDTSILFDVNSTDISEEGKVYLDDFIATYVTTIKPYIENGSVKYIVVEGHTDPDGSYEYNLDLSERRAQSVAAYMIEREPDMAGYITTVGYSYLYPILDDNGNVDKPASRRVVFSFATE